MRPEYGCSPDDETYQKLQSELSEPDQSESYDLKRAVVELLNATSPFFSALEGVPGPYERDLEEIWHRLARLANYTRPPEW